MIIMFCPLGIVKDVSSYHRQPRVCFEAGEGKMENTELLATAIVNASIAVGVLYGLLAFCVLVVLITFPVAMFFVYVGNLIDSALTRLTPELLRINGRLLSRLRHWKV